MLIVLAVLAVLGAAFGAIVWYGKGAYYVGFDGDQVVVYQGRPGGVLWIDPEQVGTYPLERSDLTEAGISRIEANPTFSSRADADAYVANLEADPAAVIPPTTTTSSTTTTSTTTTTTTTDDAAADHRAATTRCSRSLTWAAGVATPSWASCSSPPSSPCRPTRWPASAASPTSRPTSSRSS